MLMMLALRFAKSVQSLGRELPRLFVVQWPEIGH